MKILVLYGGDSPEREVSLHSGSTVAEALKEAGHEAILLDTLDGFEKISEYKNKVDCVFPILHGVNGEDGEVQKVLEKLDFKFLGAESTASRNAFDKITTHEILERHNILMPRFKSVSIEDLDDDIFGRPYVLKPINGGSSLDTQIVREVTAESLEQTMKLLNKYENMLVEELIDGQEITVPVLGDKSLAVIAIVPPENEEFNYENKYNDKSKEICPAPIDLVSEEIQKKAQHIAMNVHELLDIRHLSRTDFIVSDDGRIYTLELNTIPGMRPQSLFPKAAKNAGMNMSELTDEFVKLVMEK